MKLISVELTSPLPAVSKPALGQQWILVRLHGYPLGILRLEDRDYAAEELTELAITELLPAIRHHLVADGLVIGGLESFAAGRTALPAECPRPQPGAWPDVTVVVCTRDRADHLLPCLDALLALDYPVERLELLIVDNAPRDASTERAVRARSTRLRYVCEPRPGLDWARNRGILESRGEIIAYTDDDVSVDCGWARALATVFLEEPAAMALTGLVVADEVDYAPQLLFEQYGGFGRGFVRRYFIVDVQGGQSAAATHGGAGKLGTGANMAFRRSVFDQVGLFDPALDVGTPTNGGGDLEMFYRVLKAGHLLVYEPSALVRHRHRREYAALRNQLTNNGIGFYSYLVRSARQHPEERAQILRLGLWWFWYWNLRRLLRSFVRPVGLPRDLILAELRGSVMGLRRYARAERQAAEIARRFGPQVPVRRGGAPA